MMSHKLGSPLKQLFQLAPANDFPNPAPKGVVQLDAVVQSD